MKIIPFTKNREFIADLLTRAKRFHCSVSGVFEYDVTELLTMLEAQRSEGREVSLMAVFVRATALVLERYPRMNHHLFRRWFRWIEVEFDAINCTLIVQREGPDGEEILFPVRVDEANKKSLEEIYRFIKWHKTSPLSELPQIKGFGKVKKMPWLALKYFSYKARSDPEFHQRYFGTYGISSLVRYGWGGVGGSALANTASGFLPSTIRDKPWVVDGELTVRRILTMGLVADHYILDGADIMRGMEALREYLETTALLMEPQDVETPS